MKGDKIDTGIAGEKMAVRYLKGIGYKILEKNWRFGRHEIDIIARDGNFIVFTEVKTRNGRLFGNPAEAVDNKKINSIAEAAEAYIISKNVEDEPRFDIISIVMENNRTEIEHIKEAFYP